MNLCVATGHDYGGSRLAAAAETEAISKALN